MDNQTRSAIRHLKSIAESGLASIGDRLGLVEQMWTIDDHITDAMRSNKTDIQDFLNELNLEVVHTLK